jgi:glucokinase
MFIVMFAPVNERQPVVCSFMRDNSRILKQEQAISNLGLLDLSRHAYDHDPIIASSSSSSVFPNERHSHNVTNREDVK